MLYKTKRAIMWAVTLIFVMIVLCWVFYVAYVDFAINDANIKSEQYQKAYQQWSGSAAQGDTISQYRLGEMHENGLGVPRNIIEAHVWYQLSANGGLDAGSTALARLQTNMSQEQIEEAEKLRYSYANVLSAGATPTALTPNTGSLASANTPSINDSTVINQPVAPVAESSQETVSFQSTTVQSGTAVVVEQPQNTLTAVGTVVANATADDTRKRAESLVAAEDQPDNEPTTANAVLNAAIKTTDNSVPSLSVCEVQQMLNQLGFNVGVVDGLFGAKTAGAITEYQRTYGMEMTGIIDRPFIGSLLGLPWDGASIRAYCSDLGV